MFLLLVLPSAFAQEGRVTSRRAPEQRDGILDFALKQINPSNQDYGKCIDEGRKILLEETIESGYFWSNLLSLVLLGLSFLICFHQHKVQQRREVIVAESLAQYQHALARADIHIKEATSRNMALMEALSSSLERGDIRDATEQQPGNVGAHSAKKSAPNIAGTANSSPAVSVAGSTLGRSRQPSKSAVANVQTSVSTANAGNANPILPESASPPKISVETDLVSKVNMIQQQLSGSQEREKQLRRQLNEAELRLQKEQQKNRSLKGES